MVCLNNDMSALSMKMPWTNKTNYNSYSVSRVTTKCTYQLSNIITEMNSTCNITYSYLLHLAQNTFNSYCNICKHVTQTCTLNTDL